MSRRYDDSVIDRDPASAVPDLGPNLLWCAYELGIQLSGDALRRGVYHQQRNATAWRWVAH